MSPRRIENQFQLCFQSFRKLQKFENTRENLSLRLNSTRPHTITQTN